MLTGVFVWACFSSRAVGPRCRPGWEQNIPRHRASTSAASQHKIEGPAAHGWGPSIVQAESSAVCFNLFLQLGVLVFASFATISSDLAECLADTRLFFAFCLQTSVFLVDLLLRRCVVAQTHL